MSAIERMSQLFRSRQSGCRACGDCCRELSWHLHASDRDLERWRRLGRDDLLARVNRLGWIWTDPLTKELLPCCPYLVKSDGGTHLCEIHEIKPDICRSYPTQDQYNLCLNGVYLGPSLLS
ncbi:MAG: hypothetical protein C0618_12105 [Desulfuromonas sp.]|nr:MAG: hypothetical protein C0618_12105 [Desulfuromonas sp.]